VFWIWLCLWIINKDTLFVCVALDLFEFNVVVEVVAGSDDG